MTKHTILIANATSSNIKIEGGTEAGINNGIETLKSFYISESKRIPHMAIKDFPRFDFRGVSLDIASNFPGYEWFNEVY